MLRRQVLLGGSGLLGVLLLAEFFRSIDDAHAEETFEVVRTEDEWRRLLTPAQFHVLRKQGTERPFTSVLNDEHRKGVFVCAGCDLPLFKSETKFDSGTGWPSFFAPIEGAVLTSTDHLLIYPRTEAHCRRCGGHLGHVFNDGPAPTGKRYCMNGVALKFKVQSQPSDESPS